VKRTKEQTRRKRHLRVRKKIEGSSTRPRLCVFRSGRHLYAQVVDDNIGGSGSKTLCMASTLQEEAGNKLKNNIETAKKVGQMIGSKAREKGIETVVFDRGGYRYHGRVKALAEAAREAGLKF
jgi:large subunit ribosomal protein L18